MMRICLAMIVKDEAQVIRRCLDSIRPWISAWIICDTGSLDDTEDEIIVALGDLPGMIYHHPWVDFATNRTRAMRAARGMACDYIMTIDADEWLVVTDPQCFDKLTAESYWLNFRHDGGSFPRVGLFRADLDWRWEGVIHEYPVLDGGFKTELLVGAQYETASDGARSQDAEKGQKEIAALEAELEKDPQNPRLWYFLGNAYKFVGNINRAIAAYEVRTGIEGGNADEIWHSIYQIAWLSMMKGDWEEARLSYQDATMLQPRRAEAWFWWGMGHVARKEFEDALGPFKMASGLAKPAIGHLVEDMIYDYAALVNYAVTAAMAKQGDLARVLARQALALPDLPVEQRRGLERLLVEA